MGSYHQSNACARSLGRNDLKKPVRILETALPYERREARRGKEKPNIMKKGAGMEIIIDAANQL
ncbi:MAG: hypothetical protein ABI674_08340 [Spartobacteria bacterium]